MFQHTLRAAVHSFLIHPFKTEAVGVFSEDFVRKNFFWFRKSVTFGGKFAIGSLGKLIERCASMRRTVKKTHIVPN